MKRKLTSFDDAQLEALKITLEDLRQQYDDFFVGGVDTQGVHGVDVGRIEMEDLRKEITMVEREVERLEKAKRATALQ